MTGKVCMGPRVIQTGISVPRMSMSRWTNGCRVNIKLSKLFRYVIFLFQLLFVRVRNQILTIDNTNNPNSLYCSYKFLIVLFERRFIIYQKFQLNTVSNDLSSFLLIYLSELFMIDLNSCATAAK